MDIWAVLGIPKTVDISIIKKAYAQKLKIFHPEEDPDGYQRLREAYDAAQKYAKASGRVSTAPNTVTVHEPEPKQPHESQATYKPQHDLSTPHISGTSPTEHAAYIPHHDLSTPIVTENSPTEKEQIPLKSHIMDTPDTQSQPRTSRKIPRIKIASAQMNSEYNNNPLTDFMEQVRCIYEDFFTRIEIESWKRLLLSDVMWDMGKRAQLNDLLLAFFRQQHFLPQKIWIYLDESFHWSETYHSSSPNRWIMTYILNQINQKRGMSYSFFNTAEPIDFDTYLDLREKAQTALNNNELDTLAFNLSKCKEIYRSDPELFRMEGLLFYRSNKPDEALDLLNLFLSSIPDDVEALSCRAALYCEKYKHHLAIRDYLHILELCPKDIQTMYLLARSYLQGNELAKGVKYLIDIFNIEPHDQASLSAKKEARKLLKRTWEVEHKKFPNDFKINKLLRILSDAENSQPKPRKREQKTGPSAKRFALIAVITLLVLLMIGIGFVFFTNTPHQTNNQQGYTNTLAVLNQMDLDNLPSNMEVSFMTNEIICFDLAYKIDPSQDKKSPLLFTRTSGGHSVKTDFSEKWLCVGKIQEKYMILALDQAGLDRNGLDIPSSGKTSESNTNETIDLMGTLCIFDADDILSDLYELMKKNNMPESITENLISDRIVVTDYYFSIPDE